MLAFGTVALAIFTLVTLLVTPRDNTAIIDEARTTATQQHNDTLGALTKTESTIAALKSQAGVLRDQLNEMMISRRAWVSADFAVVDQISMQDGSVPIHLRITMRNTGRSPANATNINTEAITLIDDANITPERLEYAILRLIYSKEVSALARPYSRGDTKIIDYTFALDKDKIDKYWSKQPTMKPFITPFLAIICIAYAEIGDAAIHHTSSVISIGTPTGAMGIRTDIPIPANQVILRSFPFGAIPPD